MKIIIAGATGFIGKNLLKYFSKKDNEIIAIYNKKPPSLLKTPNIKWVQADLRSPNIIKEYLPNTDLFLQFAATTSGANDIKKRPFIHVTDNAVMNSYLLREAFEAGVKHFIFPSCTVMLQSREFQSEKDWNPKEEINENYYGVGNTKVYIEKMCRFYSGLGLKTTVIRHSNVFGPYDKFDLQKSHVLGASVRKVLDANEGDIINVWGSGKARRDFIFISELINFIEKAFCNQKELFGLFNCGMGYSISINELVKNIISISKKNLEMKNDLSKPDIPTALSLDCNKAYKEINWKNLIDFNEALEITYKWAENNL
tara:strand:- start:1496 stop:2437 length:942 start_codon:yes stop_codon:yes gene_type:complete